MFKLKCGNSSRASLFLQNDTLDKVFCNNTFDFFTQNTTINNRNPEAFLDFETNLDTAL